MHRVSWAIVIAIAFSTIATAQSQSAKAFTPPRTPWGDPDLQGIWPGTSMVGVPLQRPQQFGDRNVLTDDEFETRVRQAKQTEEDALADFDPTTADTRNAGAVGSATSPPPHWLERGQPSRQASLIVDPPNGRMPAMTPVAQQREAQRRAERASRGSLDSYTDFSLFERCISRGLTGSILPGGYNNGNQIVQSPGYVTIVNEMIHESRVVPLDDRSHLASTIRNYMGDSRGRWDGDTLVVETTNFADRAGVGMNDIVPSEALKITERFSRTSATTISYSIAVDDPMTWTAPFTIRYQLTRDDRYGMFEYACHEGNYALQNILSGARAGERSPAETPRRSQP
jgi:hypothetical protein